MRTRVSPSERDVEELPREAVDRLVEAVYSTQVSVVSGALGAFLVAALVISAGAGRFTGSFVAALAMVVSAVFRIALVAAWRMRRTQFLAVPASVWETAYAVVGAVYSITIGTLAYFVLTERINGDVAMLVIMFAMAYVGLLPTRSGIRPRVVMAQAMLTMVPGTAGFLFSDGHYAVYIPIAAAVFMFAVRDATRGLYGTVVSMVVARGRLDAALNNMSHGLVMLDNSMHVQVANTKFREFFALSEAQVAQGSKVSHLVSRVLDLAADRREREALKTGFSDFLDARVAAKIVARLRDGRVFEFSLQPMADGVIASVEDVTRRDEADRRIMRLARFDSVTGLPNRNGFRDAVDAAIADGMRGFAVLAVDLDRFKQVNDTLGHPAGDRLLSVVAKRLTALAEDGDVVSRFGGDEFVILRRLGGRTRTQILASDIVAKLSAPYDIDGARVSIGASVGVAIDGIHGNEAEMLIKRADLALYEAKDAGRGVYRMFDPDMEQVADRRRKVGSRLREALANGALEVWYQPIVDAESGRTTACEALLRWRDPERGLIAPSEFMQVAEETGFIVEMGDWVLARACRDAASWPSGVRVAVNFSLAQFASPGLVSSVEKALTAAGIEPSRLEVEVAESTIAKDVEASMAMVQELRRIGVRVSFDDFGRGASSLSCLDSFRPDRVKMDRSFVRGIHAKASSSLAIVRALACMSEASGFALAAEGVETDDQLNILKGAGVTELQGYLFSRPVASEDMRALLCGKPRLVAAA